MISILGNSQDPKKRGEHIFVFFCTVSSVKHFDVSIDYFGWKLRKLWLKTYKCYLHPLYQQKKIVGHTFVYFAGYNTGFSSFSEWLSIDYDQPNLSVFLIFF